MDMLGVVQLISISAIFDYVGDQKRCLIEGEEVFKRKHITFCGIRTKSAKEISVFALCLSTSSLHGKPHELSALFTPRVVTTRNECKIDFTVESSCIAGKSKKCKHCIGLLLYLNAVTIFDLEDLTCTDLEQQWGKLKTRSKELYQPSKIRRMCHVKEIESRVRSCNEPLKDEIRNCLLSGAPNSALALHLKGRNTVLKSRRVNNDVKTVVATGADYTVQCLRNMVQVDLEISYLESVATPGSLKTTIRKVTFDELPTAAKTFYMNYVRVTPDEAIEMCRQTIAQSACTTWKLERRKRITASECYSLYTYSGSENEWNDKMDKRFNQNFNGNAATRYGLQNEEPALKKYEEIQGEEVQKLGFVVNSSIPWLGFSPDGVTFEGDKPRRLVEVKCPVAGANTNISELARKKKLAFLIHSEEDNFILNHRHKYYGQIQMGMALTGLKSSHLVLYSKFDNSVLIINVERNENFIKSLFEKLRWVYFKFPLPKLVSLTKTA